MEEQTNLLEEFTNVHEPASGLKRFINYIVDMIIFYAIIFGIFVFIESNNPSFLINDLTGESHDALIYFITFLIFFGYYALMEKNAGGRTIGKLLTGTKAIREDGEKLTAKDAILRTLCRFVPFEPLSGFGTPWHDSWTKTTVVNAR